MGAGTARALFVLESLDALIVKGTALLAHRDMADAQSLSNHHVRLSFPTGQNNLGALHQAVTQAAGTGHGLLLLFLFLTKADGHGRATNGHGPTPCTAFPPILSTSLPGRFTRYLDQQGLKPRGGQIIDATLVPVPKQRNRPKENEEIKQGKVPEDWQDNPNRLRQKGTSKRER